MLTLDWAEPGDPPNADYKSVKAPKPPGKPVRYASLTREREIELVRRYHESGDLNALEELVEAHRPMVARMATGRWRGNGTSLAALVEYGMFGLTLAAQPPRPSKTKKGAMVVFDPNKGRFSTYARSYAAKEMRAAVGAVYEPLDDAERATRKHTDEVLFEGWAEPAKEEWEEGDHDPLLSLGGHKVLFRDLQGRRPYHKPSRPWALWNPLAKERKVRPRNFLKHSRTKTELSNLTAYQARYWTILKAYEKAAADVLDGWQDGDDPNPIWSDAAEFMVASLDRNHAFKGKEFRLPKEVLLKRWKLGCERLGHKIPFKFNAGLGLFDKFGHRLPDFTFLSGKVIRLPRKGTMRVPFLCLRSLASIYYMRGEDALEVISRRRYQPKWNYSCLEEPNHEASDATHRQDDLKHAA